MTSVKSSFKIGKPTTVRASKLLSISGPIRYKQWIARVDYVLKSEHTVYVCVHAQDDDPKNPSAFDVANVQLSTFVVSRHLRFKFSRCTFFGILKYKNNTQRLVEHEPNIVSRAKRWIDEPRASQTLYTEVAALMMAGLDAKQFDAGHEAL